MAKIKVLMVGNSSSVHGGITSVIQQLLNHDWQNENIQMKFIPTYVDCNLMLKIIYFLASYLKISKYLRLEHPDIVHIHMSYKGSFTRAWIIYKLSRRYNARVIVHLHGSEFENWFNSIPYRKKKKVKRFLQEINVLIVLGNKWKEKILNIEPSTNIIVVSNTVEIPKYVNEQGEKLNVLFLGVLHKRKGVDILIDAIDKLVIHNKLNSNVNFIIAGSGPELKNLKHKVNILGLSKIIHFEGWIEGKEKKELMKKCQLLVLPSYAEGLPVSILEAISYGMPVIASNVGDISSAVIDGWNGYLIVPGDSNKLMISLDKIINDRDRYQMMSSNSRKLAIKKFSSDNYFKVLKDIYMNKYELSRKEK